MGRRKITIAPIVDDRNRSVTFLKRKGGLFKKAYELGVLCGADVAVIVFAGNGKLYEFSSGDLNSTLMRYSNHDGPPHEHRGPGDFDGTKIKGIKGSVTAGVGARAQAHGTGAEDDDDDDDLGDEGGDDAGEVSEDATNKSKAPSDSVPGSMGPPLTPWSFLAQPMPSSSGPPIPGFPSSMPPGAYPSPFDPSSFPPHPGHPGFPSFPPAYYAPYPSMHPRHPPPHSAGGPTVPPAGSPGFPNIFGPGLGGYPGMPPPLPHGQGNLAGLGGPPPGYANLAAAAAAAEVYWGFSAQPPQGSPHPQTAAAQVAQPRYDSAAAAAAAASPPVSGAPSFGITAGSAGDLSAYRLSGGSTRAANAPASASSTAPPSSPSNLADVSISRNLRRAQTKDRTARGRGGANVAATRRAADQGHEEDQNHEDRGHHGAGSECEGEARGRPRARVSPPDPGSADTSSITLPAASGEEARGRRKEEAALMPSPGSFLPGFDDPADSGTFEWPGTGSRG